MTAAKVRRDGDEERESAPEGTGRYRPAPDALFRQVGEEAVILDLATQRYFGLDEVGARLWQLMEEHGQLEAIARAMAAEFEVDPDRARRDARELFARLAGHGLLEGPLPAEPDPAEPDPPRSGP